MKSKETCLKNLNEVKAILNKKKKKKPTSNVRDFRVMQVFLLVKITRLIQKH